MTALLSVLGLLAAWAILANLERLPWPPQRQTAIHDQTYWQAVQRDSELYLKTHGNVSEQIRCTVAAMGTAAQQRLGGMAR